MFYIAAVQSFDNGCELFPKGLIAMCTAESSDIDELLVGHFAILALKDGMGFRL